MLACKFHVFYVLTSVYLFFDILFFLFFLNSVLYL